MRTRRADSAGFLLLATALAGCGEWQPSDGKGVAKTIEFRLDYAAARRARPTETLGTDADLQRETVEALQGRMEWLLFSKDRVHASGKDGVAVVLPPDLAPSGDAVAVLTDKGDSGDLQFRIEVDPLHLREDQAPALWKGTAGEFTKYKEAEIAVWKKARDQATKYEPSDPRYRVVKRAGKEGKSPDDFAVVLEPSDPAHKDRFGGEILANAQPSTDESGMPSVSYEVRPAYQGAFAAWTEVNTKQPMAILLNDEFDQAPMIQTKLTDNVQITLGARDVKAGKERQRVLLHMFRPPAPRVPLVRVR